MMEEFHIARTQPGARTCGEVRDILRKVNRKYYSLKERRIAPDVKVTPPIVTVTQNQGLALDIPKYHRTPLAWKECGYPSLQ